MEFIKIVSLSVGGACLFGLVLDQITVRICVEYFTIGHPRIVSSTSPTIIALAWGIVATWWMGLILGIPLGLSARIHKTRKVTAGELIRPVAVTLLSMGFVSAIAGVIGHILARRGDVWLVGWLAESIPSERHVVFLTDLWIHSASYISGVIGGIVLILYTIIRRIRSKSVAESIT